MRSLLFCIIFLLLSISTYAQHILVIGKGLPWKEKAQQEIKQYFSGSGRDLSWLNGDDTNWESTELSKYDLIWLHRPDTLPYADFEDDPAYYKVLLDYVNKGGNILLTQHALGFVNKSRLEPVINFD